MPRLTHGQGLSLSTMKFFEFKGQTLGKDYTYLFPELSTDPTMRLPDDPEIGKRLAELASTIALPEEQLDGSIPAAYTYLGQFIDHDITLDATSDDLNKLGLSLQPLADPTTSLRNARTAPLDLDSVYDEPARRDGDKLLLGTVTPLSGTNIPFLRPDGKGDQNDLPRRERTTDPSTDREALIGDPRNDENTIVSQLHVAFLKAHNALVDEGRSFAEARTELRRMYQRIILHDFLPKICDPAIVKDVFSNGPKHFRVASAADLRLPLEFSVAAYRFGHSMIRASYDFNVNFGLTPASGRIPASLQLLFTFTALSGQLGDFATLPDNWIIG
jgi:hypothetical protein